ncbi:MAG: flagellar assembly peptidoglycan hydrolase FlgJ [Burkholderiaceae bacterium]|nr:flagellar assembly peptidoglycan hydrolase FlgJ [Burkholderiaceae bacterium]
MAAIPNNVLAARGAGQSPQQTLASDASALDGLRRSAAKDPKNAAREAAKQFEALFMQQVLKSMRAASEAGAAGLMDNASTRLGTEMLDAQLMSGSAGKPGGLAELIAKQLERQMGVQPESKPANAALPAVRTSADTPRVPKGSAAAFVEQHTEAAQKAERATGIPANFMIAQSALETGWGGKEIIGRDGTRSNNLFGIKAGSSWNGPTVDVTTTEVINGQAQKVVQKFRAYASHAESFADYARLIGENPRYAGALKAGANAKAFAQGLQNGGYATDPQYATKLARVIDTTQRLQRDLA